MGEKSYHPGKKPEKRRHFTNVKIPSFDQTPYPSSKINLKEIKKATGEKLQKPNMYIYIYMKLKKRRKENLFVNKTAKNGKERRKKINSRLK